MNFILREKLFGQVNNFGKNEFHLFKESLTILNTKYKFY